MLYLLIVEEALCFCWHLPEFCFSPCAFLGMPYLQLPCGHEALWVTGANGQV